jgi:hypothetical protein
MKRAFLLSALLAFVFGCASNGTIKTDDLIFSRDFEVSGHSREKLLDLTRQWIAQTFRPAQAQPAVECESRERGRIVGNGTIKYPCEDLECMDMRDSTVSFAMKVEVKDNQFTLTFSNLGLKWPGHMDFSGYHPGPSGPLILQKDYDAVRPKLLDFGNDIKAFIDSRESDGPSQAAEKSGSRVGG